MRWPALFVIGLLVSLGTTPSAAQRFETLEVRASATQNVNRNFLHTRWQRGFGLDGSVTTPFYLGYLEGGGSFHRYRVAEPVRVPGFDALHLFAGWGLRGDVGRLRVEGGLRLGNYRMTFDESTFAGVRTESELVLSGRARMAVQVAGPLSLYVAGDYLKVYTFLRLKLWYASAGLSYRFQTPGWMKTFLR
jgi:hypothetical protein